METTKRKLSLNSILSQYEELETLKKTFDLIFFSKGEIYIQNIYNQILNNIMQSADAKIRNLHNLRPITRENTIDLIEIQKSNYISRLDEEKKMLAKNLNLIKSSLDLDFKQISTKIDSMHNQIRDQTYDIREALLKLKVDLKNYIKHFLYLTEFRLDFIDSPNSLGSLIIYPKRYYLSSDIINRFKSEIFINPTVVRFDKKYKLVKPLKRNFLFATNKDEMIILDNLSNERAKRSICCELRLKMKIVYVSVDVDENFVYLLVLFEDGSCCLQFYNYDLKLIKSRKLDKFKDNERPKLTVLNDELFILKNFNDPSEEKIYYEVYDLNLAKTSFNIEPKSFQFKKNLRKLYKEPEIIGSTKESLFIAIVSSDWNDQNINTSISLVNKETGFEIKRMENDLFMECDCLCLTNEIDSKLLALSLCKTKPKLLVFSLNGAKLKEIEISSNYNFDKESSKKVYFTNDGYFSFQAKNESYFF